MNKVDLKVMDLKDHYIKIGKRTVNVVKQLDFSDTEYIQFMIRNDQFVDRKGYADLQSQVVWIYRTPKDQSESVSILLVGWR